MHRAQYVLVACIIFSALGIFANTTWPPTGYAYIQEQALVFLFAAAALLLSRTTINGAVFMFCSTALIPVLAMIQYYQTHIGGQMIWIAAPIIGVLTVASLTKSEFATVAYTVVALAANVIIGAIYADAGQAGALCALTFIIGIAMSEWCKRCNLQQELEQACTEMAGVQRVLEKITGELGHVSKRE